jgi:hypothetical protein
MRRSILIALCAAAITTTAPTAMAEPSGDNFNYAPYGDGVPVVQSGGPVPTMNGVPCVGGHLGTCISFAQNQPPPRRPSTGVGHSPTVRR